MVDHLRAVAAIADQTVRRRVLREAQRSVHPDKWPDEQRALATLLFQLIQGRREAVLAGNTL